MNRAWGTDLPTVWRSEVGSDNPSAAQRGAGRPIRWLCACLRHGLVLTCGWLAINLAPVGSPEPDGSRHLGDVLISVPTARRQAEDRGHPAERELKVLLLHGLLHCLGYDHETDQGEMERLERRLRRAWIGEDHV